MKQRNEIPAYHLYQTLRYTYYQSSKPAGCPILFISGLFAGDWIWEAILPPLRENDVSLIVLREPLASLGPTVDILCSYLKCILDDLNIYRAILVGNSYGGLLALEIAARYPERVQSIVVSGSPGLGSAVSLGRDALGVSRVVNREFAMHIASQLFYDHSLISEEMLSRTLATFSSSSIILNMLRLLKAEKKYDVRAILPRIQCETLLLWGQNDAVTPLSAWEQNQSLLKKASLKVIADCGHTAMIEKAAQFYALMWSFLTSTESIVSHEESA